MPRLLLVDDNPSIHRIAESLLTGTSVELVCVESGEEALRRLNAGEHFDVALLDTVLGPGGMDGWALLDRLRQSPATAKLPVALMAGVLDAVDPLRLETAPIQGFLRKPIELRDLEERLRAYMSAPVEGVGRGTVPGAKLQDWMSEGPAAPAPAPGPEPENDLLVLTAEDLLEPEPKAVEPHDLPVAGVEAAPSLEPTLNLENLDLDTLHGLTPEPMAGAVSASGSISTPPAPDLELPPIPSLNLDEPLSHETLSGLAPMAAGAAATLAAASLIHHHDAAPTPPALPELELDTLHGVPASSLAGAPAVEPAWSMAPTAPAPSAPAAPAPTVPAPAAPGEVNAVVQALLADPSAREALVKALLSQGGEQVLREVAWEVMPDLASKLQK